jgi:hypothetical protein
MDSSQKKKRILINNVLLMYLYNNNRKIQYIKLNEKNYVKNSINYKEKKNKKKLF